MTIRFNISPSALNLYNESPLRFFYIYILKQKQDTTTPQCYGQAGTAVHEVLDKIIKNGGDIKEFEENFNNEWSSRDLYYLPDLKNRPLQKSVYKEALDYGVKLLNDTYIIEHGELEIIIPFLDNGKHKINFKGKIDCVGTLKSDPTIKVVMDWKTSSSMDSDKRAPGEPYTEFELQGYFYSWLVYKKFGYIVDQIIFEYLKLKKPKPFYPTLEKLQKFEKYLYDKAKEIVARGNIIDNYEIGNIDSIFNGHKKACEAERARRHTKQTLIVERGKDNVCTVKTKIYDTRLLKALRNKYSYECPGTNFSEKFKEHLWDGRKYLFNNDKFPYPFINNIRQFLRDFNKHFHTNYEIDLRQPYLIDSVVNCKYNSAFKPRRFEPYYYQDEAKEAALNEKIGIIFGGTSCGKTIIAEEIIRALDNRVLFLVNRIELVRQTAESFRKGLGIEVGETSEGNLDIDNQVTVASIQTLVAILERNDDSSKQLLKYLYNVNCIIYDEAQNLSNITPNRTKTDKHGNKIKVKGGISMYGKIARTLTNCEHFIGLSGSPHRRTIHEKEYGRNGEIIKKRLNNTLEMNSIVGFIIYTKTTKELEDEGFITPTKCFFIDYKDWQEKFGVDYHQKYDENIMNNDIRNNFIYDVLKEFRQDKKFLTLTKKIDHGKLLNEEIEDSFLINSHTGKKQRKENYKLFDEGRNYVLIGSTQIFSAGVDIPDLDMIIFANASMSDIEVIQSVGRVKRKSPGKKYGYYIDFYDNFGTFKDKSDIRIEVLEDYGNEVKVVSFQELVKEIKKLEGESTNQR